MLQIVILSGPPGEALPTARAVPLLAADVTIGRSPGCSLVLADSYVSREHCRVSRTDEGWRLTVSARINPVNVGEAEYFQGEGQLLRVGDVIRVGHYLLGVVDMSVASSVRNLTDAAELTQSLDSTRVDWDLIFTNDLIHPQKTG